jgi:hypothetical protein
LAAFVGSLVTSIAFASSGTITDESLNFSTLSFGDGFTRFSCGDCSGGGALYTFQSGSTSVTDDVGMWDASSGKNHLNWYAYIPNAGSGNFAAVQYSVSHTGETFYVTVNQTNWKGSEVYLGNFDTQNTSAAQVRLPDKCVSGFWCGGLKLYYDYIKYTY